MGCKSSALMFATVWTAKWPFYFVNIFAIFEAKEKFKNMTNVKMQKIKDVNCSSSNLRNVLQVATPSFNSAWKLCRMVWNVEKLCSLKLCIYVRYFRNFFINLHEKRSKVQAKNLKFCRMIDTVWEKISTKFYLNRSNSFWDFVYFSNHSSSFSCKIRKRHSEACYHWHW